MANELREQIDEIRIGMYRFLSGLYLMEVDAEQLAALKKMQFPDISGETPAQRDLAEGYRLMASDLEKRTEADLDDLAADYAKVFLAAGAPRGDSAFPFESVYAGKKREVCGRSQQEMHVLYAAKGLKMREDTFRTMEDHLGLQLEYMAKLCETAPFAEQRRFFQKHLINWVISFTSDAAKYADTDFYRGLASITAGFLKEEQELFREGGALWDTV